MTLRLGGLVPWSNVDYPGHQAAVLFCGGCPWRCRYCHNSHLWEAQSEPSWETAQQFLNKRRGLLDAVVISGGEPLAQVAAVQSALIQIRDMGFEAALHTAGVSPRRLARLLPLVDWVGLDVKGPFARYAAVTGRKRSGLAAREAIGIVLASGKPYELRTTVHPDLLCADDLIALVTELTQMGAPSLTLKDFRATGCPDPALSAGYRPWLSADLRHRLQDIMPGIILPTP
ncbi:MAG TPA: anaerobic ribonucleoside-triphosphate reductase activating protein [Acidiferrobacter sp.]|nr:anaerobic ribonucleoside-triphosphate reductase activating protein [Acidiferrobacter sp.]